MWFATCLFLLLWLKVTISSTCLSIWSLSSYVSEWVNGCTLLTFRGSFKSVVGLLISGRASNLFWAMGSLSSVGGGWAYYCKWREGSVRKEKLSVAWYTLPGCEYTGSTRSYVCALSSSMRAKLISNSFSRLLSSSFTSEASSTSSTSWYYWTGGGGPSSLMKEGG